VGHLKKCQGLAWHIYASLQNSLAKKLAALIPVYSVVSHVMVGPYHVSHAGAPESESEWGDMFFFLQIQGK
jgi:hypothetical protein